jgi:DNA segregation ATPase FtsK/SpoIIIE, S-DNA-T family
VVLVGLSLLLLLSLVSYEPFDVGNRASNAVQPVHNFIGPVGAWLAFGTFQVFGVAAYFLMLVLAVIGVLLLLQQEVPWRGKFGAGLLLLLSSSCLLHVAGLRAVVKVLNLPDSAGGYVGLFVGDAFQRTVGKPGTLIIFGVGYVVSLILLINFRPSYWVKLAVSNYRDLWAGLRGKSKRDVSQILSEKGRDIRVQEVDVGRKLAQTEKAAQKLEDENKPVMPVPPPKYVDSTWPQSTAPAPEPVKEKKSKVEPAKVEPSVVPTPVTVAPPAAPIVLPPVPKPKREKPAEVEKAVLGGATAADGEQFVLPPLDLLEQPPEPAARNIVDDLKASAKILKDTVREFGIEVESGDVTKGPTVTLFELHPAPGVRVEKIAALSNNVAMAMRAEKVRILAPVPGKGTVGVEVPNISRTTVYLRDMLESDEWRNHKGGIPVTLGRDVKGRAIIGDLAGMPHLLIAGATGSGKTVCVNSILASLLYRYTAEDLRLVLIDPKMVEMQHYNTLPHLVVPVVTESKKVPLALGWVIREMEKRFQIFAKSGVRNITSFNSREKKPPAAAPTPAPGQPEQDELKIEVPRDFDLIIPEKMPFIVVVVDELADLMVTVGKDVEMAISRLTALGRAAGIHLVVATQRPSVNVVTGVIKANIPARIAFQVASMQDSRVILDSPGAEKLLGKGDMIYEAGSGRAVRAQGVLVLDKEINDIVDFISAKARPKFEPELERKLKHGTTNLPEAEEDDADEELIEQCIEVIRQTNRASVSILQRRLRLGYTRAARVMDTLEERGIVGPNRGAEPREILMDLGSSAAEPDEA